MAVDMEGRSIRFALTSFVGDIRCRWEEDFEFGQPLSVRRVLEGISRLWRELDASQAARVLAIGVSHPGLLDERGRLTALNLGCVNFRSSTSFGSLSTTRFSLSMTSIPACRRNAGWVARSIIRAACSSLLNGASAQASFWTVRQFTAGATCRASWATVKWSPMPRIYVSADKRGVSRPLLRALTSYGNIAKRPALARKTPRCSLPTYSKRRAREIRWRSRLWIALEGPWEETSPGPQVCSTPKLLSWEANAISGEDILLPRIQEEMRRCTIPELLEGMKIIASGLGLDIRLRGAASLAFRKCLADAELLEKMCSGILLDQCALPLAKG